MTARDYQVKAIDATFKEWESVRSTMAVCPTGCGKTHIIAGIIQRMQPRRSMVIAHREELIFQARDKIFEVAGLECEVEKAELVASTNLFNRTPVVVASVQTLISGGERKRMQRFKPSDFGCLIVDENHHSVADSYKEIISYFMNGNPNLKLFGCTATPDRADEKALGQVYESVAFDYEILDAINDGWLVPIEQQIVVAQIDYSGIRTTAGDLNGADLAAVMEAEKPLQEVAGASLEIIGQRRTLVFASSVNHAEMLCNIFNRHRAGMASWVSAKTPKDQRRQVLKQFQDGSIQIICNCGVLTEGFDNPGVEVIVMGRPTKSRSLYAQMAGRSTRPLPGVVDQHDTAEARRNAIAASAKPNCLILDFVGNSGKHKLMTTADILGGNVSDEVVERAVKKAREAEAPVNMKELLEDEAKKMAEELERRRVAEEARKKKVVASVKFTTTSINPFDCFQIMPARSRGWDDDKTLSEKQKGLLAKQGINPETITFAQGRQLIAEIFRRWDKNCCSLRQANQVRRFYPAMDTRNLGRKEASSLLDAVAKNGWRVPAKTQAQNA